MWRSASSRSPGCRGSLSATARRPRLPFWAQAGLGFLLLDLTIYWIHRMSHEVPFFWRFHAVHHSSIHLDWISGVRNHPFDGVFGAPAFAFLIGAGVSLEITGALAVIQLVTGLWAHLNVRWRLRPLHRVVLTPDFHHWHHANERDAHNTNYCRTAPDLGPAVRHLLHARRSPSEPVRDRRADAARRVGPTAPAVPPAPDVTPNMTVAG